MAEICLESDIKPGFFRRIGLNDEFSSIVGSGVGGIMTLSDQFEVMFNKGPERISPFLIPMM